MRVDDQTPEAHPVPGASRDLPVLPGSVGGAEYSAIANLDIVAQLAEELGLFHFPFDWPQNTSPMKMKLRLALSSKKTVLVHFLRQNLGGKSSHTP